MRGLAVLTVAFVFASSALFVGSSSAQGTGSLHGTVCVELPYEYAKDSTAPCSMGPGLPGATLALSRAGTIPVGPSPVGPTELTATSDANGMYAFDNIATGDYSFKVTRTGFKDVTGTVTVAAGSQKDHVLVGNPVDAKGKITDPDGGAVAQATVYLCCGENGSTSATSGADGRYQVSVQAGYWSIDVQAPGFRSTGQSLLVDGSAIDFQLERIPPQDGRISGLVHDQDGKPVAEARVSLYNYGSGCCYAVPMEASSGSTSPDSASSSPSYYSGENFTFTDAQGRFSMGAYSGENSLTVSKDGYAYHNRGFTVATDKSTAIDVELLKYPPKTARIEGRVVDAKTGDGLPNIYVGLQSPEYGLYECSQSSDSGSSGGGREGVVAMSIAPGESYPAYQGCAITTDDEGNFEGMVTPGYGILSVNVDWYSACYGSGDYEAKACGPEYYSWSTSRMLAADGTTTFDVRLRTRPAPDAEVSGYIVDAESGKALANAQVSFSNQDTYGWGSAVTDADGSYRLLLRSGHHSVVVYAEGHLHWEGVLDVPKGDTPFDVEVQPGNESYGGYSPYSRGGGIAYAAAEDSSAKSSGAPSSSSASLGSPGMSSSDGEEQYHDLGGGLGPYDAEARSAHLDPPSDGSPGLGVLGMLAAVGAVLVLRRRKA